MEFNLRPVAAADCRTLAELRAQGCQKVCVWTFLQSRSGQFYRKLGYPLVYQAEIEFGGMKHAVEVYGGDL